MTTVDERRARLRELEGRARMAELESKAGGTPQPPVAPTPEPEKEHTWRDKATDFREGAWSSVVDTGYGINELVTGDLRPDQREYAEDLRERSQESGWGTAGRVAGEVGTLLAPGGALGAAGKALTKLPKAAQAAKAAALATKGLKYDVAASAGLGAAQLPSDPTMSRTENALWGAGGALGGAAAGKVLKGAVAGVNRTPAGQRLLDKGVRLTPGKATDSALLKGAERVMKVFPSSGQATAEFQERAYRDWNKQMFNEVAPRGVKITSEGHAGFKQLQEGFNDAYDKAWAGAGEPSEAGVHAIVQQATRVANELPGPAQYAMSDVMSDLDNLTTDFTAKGLKAFDHKLRKVQEGAYGGGDPDIFLGEAVKGIRDTLRKSLDPDTLTKLKVVDEKWGDYLPLKTAGESVKAVQNKGLLDTDMVAGAIGGKGGTGGGRQLTGEAPFQQSLNDALDTLGDKDPNVLMNVMKATAQAAPSPHGLMDATGRALTGQNVVQKALRPGYESAVADALRQLGLPAKIGGAYANE